MYKELSRNQSPLFHGYLHWKSYTYLFLIIFSSIFRECTSILLQIPHFNRVLIQDSIEFGLL